MTDTLQSSSFTSDTLNYSSKSKQKREPKLKYLKYSPPSSAGPGPGAWRQGMGQFQPTTSARRSSPDDSDLDVISLSLDVANVSLDFKDPAYNGGRVNYNVNAKKGKGRRKKRSKAGGAGNMGDTSARSSIIAPVSTDPLVFNGKWTRRSTSNRLLNCFTIDDCMARYRNKLALGHGGPDAWLTGKADLAYTLATFPNPKNPITHQQVEEENNKGDGPDTGRSYGGPGSRGSSAPRTHRETSFGTTYISTDESGTMPCNNDNEALTKAMNTIFTSDEVVNNTAMTGLFKKPKRQRREKPHRNHHPEQSSPDKERPVSTRFRKMNDALHRWIDEEIILPRSRLGSMNSLRSGSQDDDSGMSGEYSPQNQNSSTPERYHGPRSMDAPNDALRRKPDIPTRLRDTSSNRRPKSAEDKSGNGNSDLYKGGPNRSDSFLEMLMEMDEDKQGIIKEDPGRLTVVADREELESSAART